ncbi:MAG: NifB/NifX family molybdenum-iron cluster-binding protein [Candidatus Margulisiibacteriota bacterium]
MILAITAKGTDLNSELDPRFGRAQNYILYNTELKKFKVLSNEYINAAGGAGTAAAQLMADNSVDVVISGNFGPNAVMGLQSLNIKMFTSNSGIVSEVISAYQGGLLTEAAGPTVEGKHSR